MRASLRPAAYASITAEGLTKAMTYGESLAGVLEGRSFGKRLERTNFRGRTVSLTGGIGMAVANFLSAVAVGQAFDEPKTHPAGYAAAIAAGTGGIAGFIDDMDAGAHDGDAPAKGLHGHLGALAQGRITTGALKIAIIGSGACIAASLLATGRAKCSGRVAPVAVAGAAVDTAVSAVAIASWANVHNLLDLRPGRALKAAGLLSLPLALTGGKKAEESRALAWAAIGCAIGAAPADLGEETMLGDTGANALGALVGSAIAAHPSRLLRLGGAAAGTALVLASEKVSFSKVIAANPYLAALDAMGRRRECSVDDSACGCHAEPDEDAPAADSVTDHDSESTAS